ncbi:MAG: acyl-CoA dehydrogenase family protein, partial [Deltaproteobacteria bacterium]|nr:acyl-CoA dehydrogenase family protein [Deltaproteobacteria bacterium]
MIELFANERVVRAVQSLRTFVEKELIPLERALTHTPFVELVPELQEKRRKAQQTGLWAPQMPEALGGAGLSLMEFAFVSEELGRTPIGHYVFNCQAPDSGNMELLLEHGSDEQRERFLKPLVRGEIRSCFTMTEPEFAGSNPIHMGTTARVEGDEFVINGHKWFATAADGAAFAVCMAVTDADATNPYGRASMIIVPTSTPGFELISNISVMGHRGSDYASHGEVMYQNCRVPLANLLGRRQMGFAMAQERLGPGRIHHCMRWIGICERAFALMCKRAVERELAPGKPLATRQIVQQWIAESRAE